MSLIIVTLVSMLNIFGRCEDLDLDLDVTYDSYLKSQLNFEIYKKNMYLIAGRDLYHYSIDNDGIKKLVNVHSHNVGLEQINIKNSVLEVGNGIFYDQYNIGNDGELLLVQKYSRIDCGNESQAVFNGNFDRFAQEEQRFFVASRISNSGESRNSAFCKFDELSYYELSDDNSLIYRDKLAYAGLSDVLNSDYGNYFSSSSDIHQFEIKADTISVTKNVSVTQTINELFVKENKLIVVSRGEISIFDIRDSLGQEPEYEYSL